MNNIKTVCELNMCTGCMACLDSCHVEAITVVDSLKSYNAIIDETKCINCNACHTICQNNNPIKFNKTLCWEQGYIADADLRLKSSSGGLCAGIMHGFIRKGGYICSCLFENGKFAFKITNDISDIKLFQGSKYIKSNPKGIYNKVKSILKDNNKLLFIGLPCQVQAMKKYIGTNCNNLYTVDLICHGTPSPLLLDKFLGQYNINLARCEKISFRQKAEAKYTDAIYFSPKNQQDYYSIAFLQGLDYTENCYSCKYAQQDRVSDITLGDSWGSDLTPEIKAGGLSLVLKNTEKAEYLLNDIGYKSYPVEKDKAILKNHQLQNPTPKHKNREKFLKIIETTKFNRAVRKCLAKDVFKQKIKCSLINLKLYKSLGGYRLICWLKKSSR